MNVPDGVFMISSSIVWQDPPALMILARADSVNLRAATDNFGISAILKSSVTVPTTTTVLSLIANTPLVKRSHLCTYYLDLRCLTNLLRATGGLLVLDATSLLRIVLQKAESVLLDKNLKSYAKKRGISYWRCSTYFN